MRRRGGDYRWPARRKFPNALWLSLCGFVILLFVLVLRRVNHRPTSRSVYTKRSPTHERFTDGLNITDEMLSPDSLTRQLNDQISLAKGFLVIAKESNNLQFAWELSAQIRNSQILVSNAALRRTLLTISESGTAVRDMALMLFQAQQLHYDSAAMIMRLKAKIQGFEQQMSSTNEKSSKYGQIVAEEVPKSLFCLGVRLTGEWFRNAYLQRKLKENRQTALKLNDNSLYHFCVFSNNILATSVVVNSTSLNSKNPEEIFLHLVTDEVNYEAMKAWFTMNTFGGVTVNVQKIEDFSWLNASYIPVLKQLQDSETQRYYFSDSGGDNRTPIKFRNPKYLSMLNRLRFYIPEVFPSLKKVETCMETFHRYQKYLNYSHPLIREHFDPAFEPFIDPHLIEKGAVLHFNGNSNPWLKIRMEKYKLLWDRYVDYSHPLMLQCNVR
ncbi:hypothetical protein SASPL_130028 [Salvia splendens]|uniref:Hexosyltransferase n=1 Tax=Salvia splendens TaxID=180675 RepID=A0A8X8X4X8_SALSN|nr:hypothetical protein SASPL_130028 [Salvia splendens]